MGIHWNGMSIIAGFDHPHLGNQITVKNEKSSAHFLKRDFIGSLGFSVVSGWAQVKM